MGRPSASDRTDRRIQMFLDRGHYNTKKEVIDAAVALLMKKQLTEDSKIAAESYKEDNFTLSYQSELLK